MPQRKPKDQLSKAKADLRDVMLKARDGDYQSTLAPLCRTYTLPGSTRDQKLRFWDAAIMGGPETFFEYLEAVQMAYRQDGLMTGGYSICLEEAVLYWYERFPKHAFWTERWRQFAEMPEFAFWAEEINDKLLAEQQHRDTFASIA